MRFGTRAFGTRARAPIRWAQVHWGLGNVKGDLARLSGKAEAFAEAEAHYNAALEVLRPAAPYYAGIVDRLRGRLLADRDEALAKAVAKE